MYYLPVASSSLYVSIQYGTIKPVNIEVPIIARLRLELKSTACRLDSTTPVNIPYIVIKAPPESKTTTQALTNYVTY